MTGRQAGRLHSFRRFAPLVGAALLLCLMVAVLAACVQSNLQSAWISPRDQRKAVFGLIVQWGCWLLWPLSLLLLWQMVSAWRAPRRWIVLLLLPLLLGCGVLIWARFVEPRQLLIRETTLSQRCGVRVALISDLHLGLFAGRGDLERVVDALNRLDVDAVLVAGDWTGEPPRDLRRLLEPLSRLRHRTLSVTGNHDEESPGPPLTAALHQALASLGVVNAEARRLPLGRCELVGLGDLTSGSTARHVDSLSWRPSYVQASHRIVLTHEPGSAQMLPPDYAALALVGHTHGGQVKPPGWLEPLLLSLTRHHYQKGHDDFVRGVYQLEHLQMFVTSGIGMSDLPFRLGMPPTIDLLRL